jgi:hypothetical protein
LWARAWARNVRRESTLALLKEARSGAKRERWILGIAAASLAVAIAALLVNALAVSSR